MAAGIEHRSKDTVIQAYDYFDMPNFAIYANKDQRTFYNGGNKDEGAMKLQEWLEMIEASNTGTVYTLKVYPDTVINITTSTPISGSTTFMLSTSVPTTRNENGVLVVDRGAGQNYSGSNAVVVKDLQDRVNRMESENARLREDLHRAELKNLEDKFTAAINGIRDTPEIPWYERLIGSIEEKPELVDKLLNPIERLIGSVADRFAPRKNYIINQTGAVNGTQNAEEDQTMANTQTNQEPLTEEQTEAIHDEQDEYIEKIEARIGPKVLLEVLKRVAALDDKSLNKLLNYLD